MKKNNVEVNLKEIDIDTDFIKSLAKKILNEGSKQIQSESPHGKGKYRDGWKVKTSNGTITLKNYSKKSFIENFLENGHRIFTISNGKGTTKLKSYQYEYEKKSNTLTKNSNGKLKVNYVNPIKHIEKNMEKISEKLIESLKREINNGKIVNTK